MVFCAHVHWHWGLAGRRCQSVSSALHIPSSSQYQQELGYGLDFCVSLNWYADSLIHMVMVLGWPTQYAEVGPKEVVWFR